jgi:hypothetical protein
MTTTWYWSFWDLLALKATDLGLKLRVF